MGIPWAVLLVALHTLASASAAAIESPEYKVVSVESDFEVRLYADSVWMSSPVNNINSFHLATKLGFHRLFQYVEGANLNWSRIPMTKPVLTSVIPGAGRLNSSGYVVSFYLPAIYQDSPPVPLEQLHLQQTVRPSHCVAVRKFSGFARDKNVVKEAQSLAMSLGKSPWANSTSLGDGYVYSVAQYDSPFRLVGRLNEVWAEIDGTCLGGWSEVAAF